MQVKDPGLLRHFALRHACEWCKRVARGVLLDPHHLWRRGMGGGGQLDIRVNLVALCRTCHTEAHAGQITRSDLLAIVAAREGVLQDAIVEQIRQLRSAER